MESQVRRVDLVSSETKTKLKQFYDFIQNSYGPFGRCALFPSPVGGGGVVCLTSRSERLLQMIKMDSPVLKLMGGVFQGQVANYKDCGLYASLLATKLVMSGLQLQKSRHQVAMVTGHTLSMVSEWLRSDSCLCKQTLSLTSSKQMMTLVKCSLSSKMTKFGISKKQLDHISSLLLQAFLHVLPTQRVQFYSFPAHIHITAQTGCTLEKTVLLHGVAIAINDAQLIGQIEGDERLIRRTNDGDILTAVFDVSLAGDLEEDLSPNWSLHSTSPALRGRERIDDLFLERLVGLSTHLVTMGVGMVGCQKCVHPVVKERLRAQGVVVVERLSSVHIQSVREVTEGQMNSLTSPNSVHLGKLKALSLTTVGNERFLCMEGGVDHVTPHCTLVLCTPTETMNDELVPLCNNIIVMLEHSLSAQYSFVGGGCADTIIAHMIRSKVSEEVADETLSELECDQSTYRAVMESVSKCFSALAGSLEHYGGLTLTDSSHHHSWSFPPYDYCTPITSQDQSDTSKLQRQSGVSCQNKTNTPKSFFSKTKCCCGSLSLCNLPSGTKLTNAISNDSISVPDSIHSLMEQVKTDTNVVEGGVQVMDFGLPKVKAIETAGDIASTVLHISHSLSNSE